MNKPILNGCLAQKIQMSRMVINGKWAGVTLLWAPSMVVVALKAYENLGVKRSAIQVGLKECRAGVLPKPQRAELEKLELPTFKLRKEFTCFGDRSFQPGDKIEPDEVFQVGQTVSVSGITIGRGMSGVMKRHNFAGGRASHGTSKAHRQMGSTGYGNTSPARVFKNKKMPGHYGCERVTHHGLSVVAIDTQHQIIVLSGSVPGKEGWIEICHRNL